MKRLLLCFLIIAFPAFSQSSPVRSNPRDVLNYPIENWRDSRYEFFLWDDFPQIIIFDTATFAVQDRLFKRLAFFVEKLGFRGRLMTDSELVGLHGWNAHDYRAESLAEFFETARRANFPLTREERELQNILLQAGIIRRNSFQEFVPGTGAVLSLSRESDRVSTTLRPRFMAHEAFHGLFFIDEDFRLFSRQRWDNFPDYAKEVLLAYFYVQQYDLNDEFLMVKEFKGHILQQTTAGAAWFFGEFIPNRLLAENPSYAAILPAREERTREGNRFWPDLGRAFTSEAEAFSNYVNNRWGFAAGRPWR
ncbi:MAG: hypothetical protein FWG77_07510 [Treponema sp.]|nr:hypothetical protein [Treponema sp.]